MTSTGRQSGRVAEGAGMFNLPKVAFSKQTQDLLKVMMAESKLTNFQQRQLKSTLQNGHSLPLECNPTSSVPGRVSKPAARKRRFHSPAKQGLRTKDTINKLTEISHDDDDYRPRPIGYNSTKEKERLQNVMAFGKDLEPPSSSTVHQPQREEEEEEIDRFEEVMGEIEERRQFLEDMAALGQDKPHRNRILTEISQRIRELEVIDQARCAQLKLQIES